MLQVGLGPMTPKLSTSDAIVNDKSDSSRSSDEDVSALIISPRRVRKLSHDTLWPASDMRHLSNLVVNATDLTCTNKKSRAVSEQASRRYDELSVGDCVLMDSGNPGEIYVALVSSVHPSRDRRKNGHFVAQWYYKVKDIKKDDRTFIKGNILENEIFLSPHKDRNSIDAIVGFCHVVSQSEYDTIKDEIDRGFRENGNVYYVCRYKYFPARSSSENAFEPIQPSELSSLDRVCIRVGEEYQASIPKRLRIDDCTLHSRTCDKAEGLPTHPFSRDSVDHILADNDCTQVWCSNVSITQATNILLYSSLIDAIRYSIGNTVKIFQNGVDGGHVRCLILSYLASEALLEVLTSKGEILKIPKSEACSYLTDDIILQNFYLCRYNISLAVKMGTEHLWNFETHERDAFKREVVINTKVRQQPEASS